MHYQAIVIGSGPAGCTAALYLARANRNPLLITGLNVGGQLTETTSIENWPGAFDFPSGLDLMDNMMKHLDKFQVKTLRENVVNVDFNQRPFTIKTTGEEYSCDVLIVATGSSARFLNLPSEKKFIGNGISACATCDGFFYRRKNVAVIGGGSTAATDAVYLASLATEVHLIHRRSEFRCEKILLDKIYNLAQEGKIILHTDSTVEEFQGDDFLTGVVIKNLKTQEITTLPVDGVFEAIGHSPNTAFLNGHLKLSDGYILCGSDKYKSATSVPGVFAAGDVADKNYQQAIVAAGSGCIAALDADHYLTTMVSHQ